MTAKRPAWLTRWPAAATLAAAGILTIGMSVGSTALGGAAFGSAAPAARRSAARLPGPDQPRTPRRASARSRPEHDPAAGRSRERHRPRAHAAAYELHGGGRRPPGQLPEAVWRGKLPAGPKNKATVSQPVSDLATLVDTRTWTSGGGDTPPGATVPLGIRASGARTPRPDGGGYIYGDTSLSGYSLTHVSRARLRRRTIQECCR